MPNYTLALGKGLQFLVIVGSICLVLALGFGAGMVYVKLELEESNVDVMSNDSKEAVIITKETKVKRKVTEEQINDFKEPIIDKHGYMSNEFMLLMESTKSDAELRGNTGNIFRRLTHP